MKVWEALEVLEKMDPNVEVTLGFQDYSKKSKNNNNNPAPAVTAWVTDSIRKDTMSKYGNH